MKEIYRERKRMEEMLKIKEDRYKRQIEILSEYEGCLLTLTLNIPGEIKRNDLYTNFHFEGIDLVKSRLKDISMELKYEEYISREEGLEWLGIVDGNKFDLKKEMIDLEGEREVNRILDIDVFDRDHNPISRGDLGLERRKCLICNDDAKLCIRSRKHSYEDLVIRVDDLIENR